MNSKRFLPVLNHSHPPGAFSTADDPSLLLQYLRTHFPLCMILLHFGYLLSLSLLILLFPSLNHLFMNIYHNIYSTRHSSSVLIVTDFHMFITFFLIFWLFFFFTMFLNSISNHQQDNSTEYPQYSYNMIQIILNKILAWQIKFPKHYFLQV